ncbi:MAG: alpha/beta fold hydrolase [Dehalococcoidia bacterium]|nr:alpha/beta fold hydrolase [Dehalococcoidia bacterium]
MAHASTSPCAAKARWSSCIPSLGRGAADFAALAESLAAGRLSHRCHGPVGVAQSAGAAGRFTLHDYAEDVRAVIQALGGEPAHLVGHAYGNRVMRCLASDHPDLVRSVAFLACGGKVPPEDGARASLKRCFDVSLTDQDRLPSVQDAFFASGNDASVWVNGWWPCAAAAQALATRRTPAEEWWHAGTAPVLVVQGMQDRLAPPATPAPSRRTCGDPRHRGLKSRAPAMPCSGAA